MSHIPTPIRAALICERRRCSFLEMRELARALREAVSEPGLRSDGSQRRRGRAAGRREGGWEGGSPPTSNPVTEAAA